MADRNTEERLRRELDQILLRLERQERTTLSDARSEGAQLVGDMFADAQFAIHGPTVCAMSVIADDGVRALNRATSFHCQRFDSRVGPKEAKIPAIHAPDGNLVYFVPADLGLQKLYEGDFDLAARAKSWRGNTACASHPRPRPTRFF